MTGTSRATAARVKVEIAVIGAVFVLYAAFALKVLLFARVPGSERAVNVVPFASIADYVSSSASETRRFAFAEVAGNIALFVPLGFYLALTRRGSGLGQRVGVIAAVSVCVEVLQYVLAVGVSDMDDVILNAVGGLVGLLVYRLARWIVRQPSHLRTTVALLSLVVAGPVLGFLMFVVRLRM